jgi:hypothetical protein
MTAFPLVYTILSLNALSFVEIPRLVLGLAGYIAELLADIVVGTELLKYRYRLVVSQKQTDKTVRKSLQVQTRLEVLRWLSIEYTGEVPNKDVGQTRVFHPYCRVPPVTSTYRYALAPSFSSNIKEKLCPRHSCTTVFDFQVIPSISKNTHLNSTNHIDLCIILQRILPQHFGFTNSQNLLFLHNCLRYTW